MTTITQPHNPNERLVVTQKTTGELRLRYAPVELKPTRGDTTGGGK